MLSGVNSVKRIKDIIREAENNYIEEEVIFYK